RAPALRDTPVRPGGRDPHARRAPARVGVSRDHLPRLGPPYRPLLRTDLPGGPRGRRRGGAALRPDRRRTRGFRGQAHARRRDGRLVPVRGDRLHGDRRSRTPTQRESAHLHHRLRARGVLRGRRRRGVRGRDRCGAHRQGGLAEEFATAIPEIIWYLDEPVADPALVPLYFVAREARKHVKVVLSGEGADELFGGYTIYKEPLSLAPFEKVPGGVRR